MKICSVEGCNNPHMAKGLCKKHWTTVEYTTWVGMKDRCYNKNMPQYHNYGGRGIRVCDEWLHNPRAFMEYIGKKPSSKHSLDRIDNNKNYEPGNVRWATYTQQANNMSSNRIVEYKNKSWTLADLARCMKIPYITFYYRITHGWSIDKAVSVPVRNWQHNILGEK